MARGVNRLFEERSPTLGSLGVASDWLRTAQEDRTWVGFSAVALWDDELEALRPQLRKEAAAFVDSVPWQEGGTATLSIEERVAAHRRVSLSGPPSDKAVNRTIEGPAGAIRLRTFKHERPKGVLLHLSLIHI